MRRPSSLFLALLGIALVACDASPSLVVDVRSDFVAGREATLAIVTLSRPSSEDVLELRRTIGDEHDLIEGLRVGELEGLQPDSYLVVATLMSGDAVLIREGLLVEVTSSRAVTVLLTRDCAGVSCPGPSDPGSHSLCRAGRCVDPRCSEETPEHCPAPACESDDACAGRGRCGVGRCVGGECLVELSDEACGASQRCDAAGECADVAPPDPDAGSSAPDAGTDASAPDCGSAADCDDGNVCTEDRCEAGVCANPAIDAACDDGLFCNGLDQCSGGSCSVHAGDPCTGSTTCAEPSDTCLGCTGDGDCPADQLGAFGFCGGFTSTCDQTGTESRTVRSFSCVSGSCVPTDSVESRSCTRSTTGTTCGTTTCMDWGACGGFTELCDEDGTQSRSCADRVCSSGACGSSPRTENRSCTRDQSGTVCDGIYGPWECPTGSAVCVGICGYDDACDQSGTTQRSLEYHLCSSGSCVLGGFTSETMPCSRSTEGTSCGAGTCCGGSCADTQTSFDHCGGCGASCSAWGTRVNACVDGSCLCEADARICSSHQTCCPGPGGNFRCRNLQTNPSHCGACENICMSGTCDAGSCV